MTKRSELRSRPSVPPAPGSRLTAKGAPGQEGLHRPPGLGTERGDGWSMRIDALGRTRLDFVGPSTTDGLRASIEALARSMPTDGSKIDLVIDLNRLEGHNPDSRTLWTKWLIANKRQLNLVLVIVPKAASLVKMVASAVGLAAGVRLKVESGGD